MLFVVKKSKTKNQRGASEWIASSQTAAPRNDLCESVIASLRSNPAQRLRCEKRYEAEGDEKRGISHRFDSESRHRVHGGCEMLRAENEINPITV